jgi:hypothetical protein
MDACTLRFIEDDERETVVRGYRMWKQSPSDSDRTDLMDVPESMRYGLAEHDGRFSTEQELVDALHQLRAERQLNDAVTNPTPLP